MPSSLYIFLFLLIFGSPNPFRLRGIEPYLLGGGLPRLCLSPGKQLVCAIRPEWQESSILLRVYFFSDSLRGRIVGRYSSGQRGLTVNQVASPSQVRILACPPHHSCWAGDSERWWARPGHLIQGVLERQGVMPLRHGTSGRSSGVELQPSKLAVASSNLVARSIFGQPLSVIRQARDKEFGLSRE